MPFNSSENRCKMPINKNPGPGYYESIDLMLKKSKDYKLISVKNIIDNSVSNSSIEKQYSPG